MRHVRAAVTARHGRSRVPSCPILPNREVQHAYRSQADFEDARVVLIGRYGHGAFRGSTTSCGGRSILLEQLRAYWRRPRHRVYRLHRQVLDAAVRMSTHPRV